MSSIKLLIGITASISVLDMPTYLQFLHNEFPQLKVIMTQCSKFFISRNSMALIVDDIYTDMFPLPEKRDVNHISLSRWADIFIILPATAHIIAQAANGLANSLLSSTILSYENPIIFFPNMNKAMWNNPATYRNVTLLQKYGHMVIHPKEHVGFEYASGKQIKGEFMPQPDEIIAIIKSEIDRRANLHKQNEKIKTEMVLNK